MTPSVAGRKLNSDTALQYILLKRGIQHGRQNKRVIEGLVAVKPTGGLGSARNREFRGRPEDSVRSHREAECGGHGNGAGAPEPSPFGAKRYDHQNRSQGCGELDRRREDSAGSSCRRDRLGGGLGKGGTTTSQRRCGNRRGTPEGGRVHRLAEALAGRGG